MVSFSGGGSGSVTSGNIVDGTITDADINSAAAIKLSKLAPVASTDTAKSPTLAAPGTTVFGPAGSPNASWTDLDLSAVVGATTRVVLLRVTYTTLNGTAQFEFRPHNDSGITTAATAAGYGTSGAQFPNLNDARMILTMTDSAGHIDWTGQGGSQGAKIDVMAFW